jgi:hypothetical protein
MVSVSIFIRLFVSVKYPFRELSFNFFHDHFHYKFSRGKTRTMSSRKTFKNSVKETQKRVSGFKFEWATSIKSKRRPSELITALTANARTPPQVSP